MSSAPDVAITMGSYNRLPMLKRALESLRVSCGSLSHEIIVVDGGSTDGTREFLADQPDVIPIPQEGPLTGAVVAFNLAFARAVDDGCPWIVIINDDDRIVGPEPEIQRCVEWMQRDPEVGGVAFETNLRGPWTFEEWNGKPYVNKGVVRSAALMAAARAQGDPEGKRFWATDWHTYAADTQAGLLIWKLGWRVERGVGLRVDDSTVPDTLRKENVRRYCGDGTADLFTARWGDPHATDYDPEFARRFGGRIQ